MAAHVLDWLTEINLVLVRIRNHELPHSIGLVSKLVEDLEIPRAVIGVQCLDARGEFAVATTTTGWNAGTRNRLQTKLNSATCHNGKAGAITKREDETKRFSIEINRAPQIADWQYWHDRAENRCAHGNRVNAMRPACYAPESLKQDLKSRFSRASALSRHA